jgi:DNA-binding NarL/FixJ family response regulator
VIRVQIAGRRAQAIRNVAATLSSPSIEVIGSSVTLHEALGAEVDVVVVLDWDGRPYAADDWDTTGPAVLVVGDDNLVTRLASSGHASWGLVPASVRPEELRAAVVAVAGRLVVVPVTAASRLALSVPEPDEEWPAERLTPREQDVLELASRGSSNREIAAALGISEHTVKFHLASVYGKLGVTSRAGAVRRGLRRGLLNI